LRIFVTQTAQLGGVIDAWRRDPQHAGTRLRALREAAGLDQLDLAAASGLTRENISRLERRAYAPVAKTVRALAGALRVEPERFVSPGLGMLSAMTADQVANRLDVPVPRVQTWLRDEVVAATKVSRDWRGLRIVVDELDRSDRPRSRLRRLDPRYRG
jgi:transcriptional regulator with XRE-family HTH domain